MAKHKTHYEECDVLVVGGGMAGTGATFANVAPVPAIPPPTTNTSHSS